ncbi:uncharacterized protein LOC143914172 isoform X2 [Arctopsyche grandis]|uniref:uncharacterized protein LOC143914172 isoform X2 n=2 Tax=Arctopsyche grandis TaxID=121162 RepID=UPI00406D7948
MDLAETMKNVLSKSGTNVASSASSSGNGAASGAEGYVTEKLYMLLQLYLQNKGWHPSVELLQCFTELKESSMLPSAAYLQLMASRVALDTQGRLILRENGKIILPYEHFANAVMLKHMNGPHGLHLGIEGTVRAVVDSYTIGRDQFGMEKEFIIEVVQNCPNPACRYYKSQLEMTQKSIQQHLSQQPTYIPGGGSLADSQAVERLLRGTPLPQDFQLPHLAALAASGIDLGLDSSKTQGTSAHASQHSAVHAAAALLDRERVRDKGQQQIREAIIQQQNRAIAQQNLEKYGLANLEKQRAIQQQIETLNQQTKSKSTSGISTNPLAHYEASDHKLNDFLRANLETLEGLSASGLAGLTSAVGASTTSNSSSSGGGQERVVRAFAELARNLHRMRPCVRPAMCKPYGKQSEQLQKILMDTIQLVQSLRSYLPPPHIQVTSWKNDDKLRSGSVEDLTAESRKIVTGN